MTTGGKEVYKKWICCRDCGVCRDCDVFEGRAESVVSVESVVCRERGVRKERDVRKEHDVRECVYREHDMPIYFCPGITVTYSIAIDVIYSVCVPITTLVEGSASTTGAGVVEDSASDDGVGVATAPSAPTVMYCVAISVS